jgi:tetratricopeptide (TPR) repeat protein
MKAKTILITLAAFATLLSVTAGFGVLWLFWKQVRKERSERVYAWRGYQYSREAEWESAVENYTKAIALSPTNTGLYCSRGAAYYAEKDYDDAFRDFNKAVQLQPTNSLALEYRGAVYVMRTNYNAAIGDFSAVIRLHHNPGWNHYRRGATYARQHDWTNALYDYSRAIHFIPTNAMFYNSAAYAHWHVNEPAAALENFNHALRLKPDEPEYLNNLAWFLAVCPDAKYRDGLSAVGLADKACRLTDWRRRNCVDTLAAAYAETGDFTEAVKYEKQALRMDATTDNEDSEEQERLRLYESKQPFRDASKE